MIYIFYASIQRRIELSPTARRQRREKSIFCMFRLGVPSSAPRARDAAAEYFLYVQRAEYFLHVQIEMPLPCGEPAWCCRPRRIDPARCRRYLWNRRTGERASDVPDGAALLRATAWCGARRSRGGRSVFREPTTPVPGSRSIGPGRPRLSALTGRRPVASRRPTSPAM